MTDFQMGLVVSGIALLVTFLALFIFVGVILLLQKLFPPKKEEEATKVEEVQPVAIEASSDESEEALAAAIAAVAYIRSRRSGQLGASLTAGPGPFWTSR